MRFETDKTVIAYCKVFNKEPNNYEQTSITLQVITVNHLSGGLIQPLPQTQPGIAIMKDFLSDEVRVMFRPVATYRQMAEEIDEGGYWMCLRRPLFFLLILGATLSFTTSGRLIAPLVLGSAIVWSFAPVLQMIVLSGLVSVVARDRLNISGGINLFFAGQGPWLLWMLGVTGSCLLIPLKQDEFLPMRIEGVMFSFLGAFIWSSVTCYGFFRGALNLSAVKAVVVSLLYIGLVWGITMSYFLIIEIIEPYLLQRL